MDSTSMNIDLPPVHPLGMEKEVTPEEKKKVITLLHETIRQLGERDASSNPSLTNNLRQLVSLPKNMNLQSAQTTQTVFQQQIYTPAMLSTLQTQMENDLKNLEKETVESQQPTPSKKRQREEGAESTPSAKKQKRAPFTQYAPKTVTDCAMLAGATGAVAAFALPLGPFAVPLAGASALALGGAVASKAGLATIPQTRTEMLGRVGAGVGIALIGVGAAIGVDPEIGLATLDTLSYLGAGASTLFAAAYYNMREENKRKETVADLTHAARDPNHSEVIGYQNEIQQAVRQLGLSRDNNVILTIDASEEAHKIAQGVAEVIAGGNAPKKLRGMQVLSIEKLDRTNPEKDLEMLFKHFNRETTIFFFSDEHYGTLANYVKNNPKEQINFIAENPKGERISPELAKSSKVIQVSELSKEETKKILLAECGNLEKIHHIPIEESAIDSAIAHARTYAPKDFFPHNAYKLLDFAAEHATSKSKTSVSSADVVEGLAQEKKIPINFDSVKKFQKDLDEKIIGQSMAKQIIMSALRAIALDKYDKTRPLGVFLFAGPSGVGKTETARTIAEGLFSKGAFLDIPGEQLQHEDAVSTLLGAGRGYKESEKGGLLSNHISQYPYSVVLLDELEKAHADVRRSLLGLMNEGRLLDTNLGIDITAKNVIFIMTSNVAADALNNPELKNKDPDDLKRIIQDDMVKRGMAIEFAGRIQEYCPFFPLDQVDMQKIIQLRFDKIKERFSNDKIGITYSEDVLNMFIDKGMNQAYGNRGLYTEMEKIPKMITDALFDEQIKVGDKIEIIVENKKLAFRKM